MTASAQRATRAGLLAMAALAAGVTGLARPGLAADVAAGKSVFGRCALCHAIAPNQTKLGPSLWGVVGRKAGSLAGYTYSSAMAGYGQVWSEANLDAYLTHPQQVVPHTKMSFAGLSDADDRANVIAYLATLK